MIDVWKDKWLPVGEGISVRYGLVDEYKNLRMRDLIIWDDRRKRWDANILK